MVTFIITLVVTALVTYIIISLYYKYRYELKGKVIEVEDDKSINSKQSNDNIPMNTTNPAYETATTISTNTDPAYAAITH